MEIHCEVCGCVGIWFAPKWAREEAKQHAAKHRAPGLNGHVGDVRVKITKDDTQSPFVLPAKRGGAR